MWYIKISCYSIICCSMEGCKLQTTKLIPLFFLILNNLIKTNKKTPTKLGQSQVRGRVSFHLSWVGRILLSRSVRSVKPLGAVPAWCRGALTGWECGIVSCWAVTCSLNPFFLFLLFLLQLAPPKWFIGIFIVLLKILFSAAPGSAFLLSYPTAIAFISTLVLCL